MKPTGKGPIGQSGVEPSNRASDYSPYNESGVALLILLACFGIIIALTFAKTIGLL